MSGKYRRFEIQRDVVNLNFTENSDMREVYGFASSAGKIALDGFLLRPKDKPSKVLMMYMHPASTAHRLPVPLAMVEAGMHVLCAGSRYNRNDTPLIMENVVRDFGAYVRHAKEEMGYEKIVIAGWSGGGSLSSFYQSQAENPTVTQTPAGDPVDLTGLIPGDVFIWHAAHLSRARVLTEFVDPSVLDEANPAVRDRELDIYDPRNPNQPAYSADFIEHFRKMQRQRLNRRTVLVKELLDDLRTGRTGEVERALVLHRTLADPRFLDGTIDPNDRKVGWCFLGDPRQSNSIPAGIARYSTLRAWLSQWSLEDTNADALAHAPNISVPLLAIENSADDAVPGPHTKDFYSAFTGTDKSYRMMDGANHYYHNQPEMLDAVIDLQMDWLAERGMVD